MRQAAVRVIVQLALRQGKRIGCLAELTKKTWIHSSFGGERGLMCGCEVEGWRRDKA